MRIFSGKPGKACEKYHNENVRLTRLTNAFSKKVENLAVAVSLHFMHYNFCRVHQALETTSAGRVRSADHFWRIDEIVGLLDSN